MATRHLRSLPGGKASATDELFSSSIKRAKAKKKRGSKQELAPIELPKEFARYSDLFAAGRSVLKDIEFKVKFAEQRLRDFCNENYQRLFTSLKRRPPSLDFKGGTSSFKFVSTHRTTLTHEKVEELKRIGIPIDDYTELAGIDINMGAIRQHHLEEKLQKGLEDLGVSAGVIEECFVPKHELNPGFFDNLYTIIQDSLKKGEDGEEKMAQVIEILNPSSQIRNVETKLGAEQSLKLVENAEIEVDDSEIA